MKVKKWLGLSLLLVMIPFVTMAMGFKELEVVKPMLLDVQAVTVSSDDGNVPENVLDGNLATRWSAQGDGEWLTCDLGISMEVGYIGMAFFKGNARQTRFDVELSEDGKAWKSVFSGENSGKTILSEAFDIEDGTARYVKIVCHGNTSNDWNSINELKIYAPASSPILVPEALTLTPKTVSSSSDDGNLPSNTLDGDLNSRWSAQGDGEWIKYDLGKALEVSYISLAFFKGNARQTKFDIELSEDDKTWIKVLSSEGSGTTVYSEAFDIEDASARYVKLVCHGNTSNDWNSINEVKIYGPNPKNELILAPEAIMITPKAVTSSSDDGNLPTNTIDGDIASRWSAQGDGEWIAYDFGKALDIGYIGIAFFKGNARQTKFDIESSQDGKTWSPLYSGMNSGITLKIEEIDIEDAAIRHIRITGHGNTSNDWNSINEVQFYSPNPSGNIIIPSGTKKIEIPDTIVYTQPGFINPDGTVHEIHTPNPVTGKTISVAEFGVDLADNGNNDVPAIQKAMDSAVAGDEVYFPAGIYNLNSGVSNDKTSHIMLKSGVNVRGEEQDKVILLSNFSKEENNKLSTQVFRATGVHDIYISNVSITSTFDGKYSTVPDQKNPDADGPLYGVFIQGSSGIPTSKITVENVSIEKFQRYAVRIGKSHDVTIRNIYVTNATDVGGGGAGYGVNIQGEGHGVNRVGYKDDSRYNLVENSRFIGPYMRHGVGMSYYTHNNLVRNNYFETHVYDPIDIHGEDEYLNEIYGNEVRDIPFGSGIGVGNTGFPHDSSGSFNYIHDNTLINCREGIKVYLNTPDTIIENNIITSTTMASAVGILILNGPRTIIRGNKINDNPGKNFTGIKLDHDDGTRGEFDGDPKDVQILNNEIYNNDYGIRILAAERTIINGNNVHDNKIENIFEAVPNVPATKASATKGLSPDVMMICDFEPTEEVFDIFNQDNEGIVIPPGKEYDYKKEQVKSGEYSLKWEDMVTINRIVTKDLQENDWSKHNYLSFWAYSEKATNSGFTFICNSEGGYFYFKTFIDWKGWKLIEVPLDKFKTSKSPVGWNIINSIKIASTGWSMTPDPTAVLHVDQLLLSKESIK
ncbi:MAG: discoidin domain-containing protein [Spirochaetaceae bacterium]